MEGMDNLTTLILDESEVQIHEQGVLLPAKLKKLNLSTYFSIFVDNNNIKSISSFKSLIHI